MADKREFWTLLLVDAGGPEDPPPTIRLRSALKALGRRWKLRVKDIQTGDTLTPAQRAKFYAENFPSHISRREHE